MLNTIDTFLNKTTMYRLVLYVLTAFFAVAFALSFFQLLPYTPFELILSLIIIAAVSWVANIIFVRVFEAPANVESVYITAFILFFIITPLRGGDYALFLPLALWASVWAVGSKYIFAIGKKHIFNPAALAVIITSFAINESASWWIGTIYMLPVVAVGGMLVVRKIRRTDLVLSFFTAALVTIVGLALLNGNDPWFALHKTLFDSAFFFFAFIMLTEPLTTPPTKWLRIGYGALVGFLFAPALHIGSLYSTPELALVLGNLFSYAVSPKEKLILILKERVKLAADTLEFIFANNRPVAFSPGQYMEWTLAHRDPDSRGNRRYFTIASSPTESDIRIGVKFYPEPSSFKNHLAFLRVGEKIVASQRAGDFVMPKNKTQKLVFIAGGIGVTPFRSMTEYLLDTQEKRPVTLLYSNKTAGDIAYKDIFDRAEAELGTKIIYAITDLGEVPLWSSVRRGFVDEKMIQAEVPDYRECLFYISGPHGMVAAFESMLKRMGVKKSQIKTDYFPGFA
ncbi:MAG: RnfABCDGE type electron transport complex subunit D [Candidatus Lloydbacteria bacterium]|nr:RnfABCDGE type electron transport complex subunit D [Candidatus Lloydbacteria bacterium]